MNLESLQSRKPWVLGGVGAAVLLLAVSWLLVVHPRLASASDTQSQADDTDFQNSQLVVANHKLEQSRRKMGALRTQLVRALEALPPASELPDFTHEVTATAASTALTLDNISIGTPSPVTGTAVAPAAGTSASPSPSPTSDSGSSATPAVPGAAASSAATAQYQLNVTLTTRGALANQLAFVKALQNGPRRALVTSTLFARTGQAAGAAVGGSLTLTTQLNIFTAPMSADQMAQLRKLLTTS